MTTKRWKLPKITDQHLQGADYAYRILRTSPLIRGEALALLDDLIADVRTEITKRNKKYAQEKGKGK